MAGKNPLHNTITTGDKTLQAVTGTHYLLLEARKPLKKGMKEDYAAILYSLLPRQN